MMQLDVNLSARTYPIFIGENALNQSAKALFAHCATGKAIVVSDTNVWELYERQMSAFLRSLDISFQSVVVAPGEASKSMETLKEVLCKFYQFGLKRNDLVIAFGGGVIGDLAGFAAATYMRGVPFVQIPTTLLAQVDSSVGGKVAVNLNEGKNLIGAFYQPKCVIADTGFLCTLPKREWDAGMAEVVKYAAIGELELLPLLSDSEKILGRIEEIVYLCCRRKANFVEKDERDTGERMMLNFGHTFGHAIEKYHAYQKYNHGEAVAIGMALAARTGMLMQISDSDTERQMLGLMKAAGLSGRLEDRIEDIIPLMCGDKKNTGDGISLVLLKTFGHPILVKVKEQELHALFREERQ